MFNSDKTNKPLLKGDCYELGFRKGFSKRHRWGKRPSLDN